MRKDLITLKEFKEEVKKVEGFELNIRFNDDNEKLNFVLIPHYPYTKPFPDDRSVDEFLETRIYPLMDQMELFTAPIPKELQ